MLAPTSLFTENVLQPFYPRMSDRQFLLTLRVVLVSLHAGGAAVRAQFEEHDVRDGAERLQGDARERVRAAGGRHLLEARQQRRRDACRSVFGLSPGCWRRRCAGDATWPTQLVGLAFSIFGMVIGLAHSARTPRRTRRRRTRAAKGSAVRDSPLARFFLAVYVLLDRLRVALPARRAGATRAARASRSSPRPGRVYVTAFDVIANVLGYAALGLLGVLALRPRLRGAARGRRCVRARRRRSRSRWRRRRATCLRARPPASTCCATSRARCRGARRPARRSPWEQPLRPTGARAALLPGAQADLGPRRCSACGCSRSSIRRRCCSAPATCATCSQGRRARRARRSCSSPSRR